MTRAFSVATWNVENFRGDPARMQRVIQFLQQQSPDVFAIYEVTGRTVFTEMRNAFPGYAFEITEGNQTQEILGAARGNLSPFFSQRTEYQSGVFNLRPGLLLTVQRFGHEYTLLFLHTKSGTNTRDLGLRDDMFMRAAQLQGRLNDSPHGDDPANYMFMGDLNTMGMKYTYNRPRDIPPADEFIRMDGYSGRRGMRRLTKTSAATFWNGIGSSTPPSELDHVFASDHLQFRQFSGSDVVVRGWPELPTPAQQTQWIQSFSDHGLLYFEVQRV